MKETQTHAQLELIPGPLVSVSNFSWMVAILVSRHVPILDNGETGLMDLGSVRKIRRISGMPIAYSLVRPWPLYAYTGLKKFNYRLYLGCDTMALDIYRIILYSVDLAKS